MKHNFISEFEDNWEKILAEYNVVKELLRPWKETHLYDNSWDSYGIYDFPDGNAITEHIKNCPVLAQLVNQYVPDHGVVGFSRLAPRTQIKPHHGYQGNYLRMHLGLIVPDGDCGLATEQQVYRWEPGKTFVFDDRELHWAWNNTDYERVVLIVDFKENI